eukprot:Nitzschia sp. Nitz4//scaffold50_size126154//120931//122592//NITZ4_003709-RA/size126154-processed-gene-0.68-mRNA-1//-1//CDS//3329553770//8709//frame0
MVYSRLVVVVPVVVCLLVCELVPAEARQESANDGLRRYSQRTSRTRTSSKGRYRGRRTQVEEGDSYDGSIAAFSMTDDAVDDDMARKVSKKTGCSVKSKGDSGSCPPTTAPSQSPSASPTVSPAPSAAPSRSPTRQPSASPTPAPTNRPSASPTKFPTQSPSASPTPAPTRTFQPSASPTTSMPSFSPSTSPSVLSFRTETDGNGLNSSCALLPPQDSTEFQEQVLAFQYYLYTTPQANQTAAVSTLETKLHKGLAHAFLTCDYAEEEDFYVTYVAAAPEDVLEATACDTTNEPIPEVDFECGVVSAEFSMGVYFTSRRRLEGDTVASLEVLASVGEYLVKSMDGGSFDQGDIVQVTFQGFVNAEDSQETPPASETENGVAGATGADEHNSNVTSKSLPLGAVIIGLAATMFILFAIVGSRRRKARVDAYQKQLEDLSLQEEEDDVDLPPGLLGDGKVELVMDDSVIYEGDSLDELVHGMELHSDSHHCSSATCPICGERERNPTFVAVHSKRSRRARNQRSLDSDYSLRDLRRKESIMQERPNYTTSDTVVL